MKTVLFVLTLGLASNSLYADKTVDIFTGLADLAVGIFTPCQENCEIPTADSSWEDIVGDGRVIFRSPNVGLNGWWIGAFCVDGNQLRTRNMVERCTQWSGGRFNECLESTSNYQYRPFNRTRQVCRNWENVGRGPTECTDWMQVEDNLSLSFDIPVYRRVRGSGGRFHMSDFEASSQHAPLFVKTYTFENCQD